MNRQQTYSNGSTRGRFGNGLIPTSHAIAKASHYFQTKTFSLLSNFFNQHLNLSFIALEENIKLVCCLFPL